MDCSCNDFKITKNERLDFFMCGNVNLQGKIFRLKIYQLRNSVYAKVLLYELKLPAEHELNEDLSIKEPQRYLDDITDKYLICAFQGHIVLTRDQFRDLIFLEKDGESVYQYLKNIGFEDDENFKKL